MEAGNPNTLEEALDQFVARVVDPGRTVLVDGLDEGAIREGVAAAGREPDSALGHALARGEGVTGRTVTEAALDGDHAAREVLNRAGRLLGVALASFANTFDPDVIVVGGGVAEGAGNLLLDPARSELRERALPPMNRVEVKAAELGSDAGMVGAAAMAMAETEGEA